MRTQVLANNMAHADTPGFKARDVNFRQALEHVQRGAGENGSLRLRTTHADHSPGRRPMTDIELGYRIPLAASVDGNTVDSHVEQAAFAENNLQFQASLRFLSARFKGLVNALRGE